MFLPLVLAVPILHIEEVFKLRTDIIANAPKALSAFPVAPMNKDLVANVIAGSSVDQLSVVLKRLVSFRDRWHQSDNGVSAALYIEEQVNALMPFVSPDVKLSVTQFPHKKWKQPSIIARLEPKNLTSPEIIIVGGHLDTIANGGSGANQGADDNASSDSAIFETLRALVKNGFVPKRALEFQWYAAEEIGLRGSAEIADDYSSRKIPVLGMMNFDQLGYVKPGTKEIVAIFTDNGTKENVDFMRLMAKTYSGLEVQDSRCGYACSDHASWFKKGYNAGVASESKFEDSNPNTHSSKDTIDKVNVNHVMAFVRLAIGFMVELSLTK